MNRIVLKIDFLEDNGLKIDLYYLDPDFMTKSGDNICLSFHDNDYDFLMYSRKKMSINCNSIRLPGFSDYKDHQFAEHKFDDEKERYKFLKGLHKCLIQWNDHYAPFQNNKEVHLRRNKNIIMSNEFWVI